MRCFLKLLLCNCYTLRKLEQVKVVVLHIKRDITMRISNSLVVKLVDTKDLKAEGFTSESVCGSPGQSKTSYKIT